MAISLKKPQKKSRAWKESKEKLNIFGPLTLTALGVIWTLQGFNLLPGFLNVPWLGIILLGLGLSRIVMYFMGYY